MNGFFRQGWDKLLLRASIVSLVLTFISFITIILYYNSLPPFIPLFNQMPWGEERITKTIWIFIIPGISIVFFILNLIFAKYIYLRIPLIARLFSMTSFLISVLTFLFIIRTIRTAL